MAKKAAKKPAKKAAPAPKPVKISPAAKPRTKGEVFKILAESNGLSRKQVVGVFDTLAKIAGADLGKGTPVNVAGMMKITVRTRPATPAREGIDPFTKEKRMFKAKPARKVLKIRPLRALKSLV
jgi:nucleoid DNA-binding protein